MAVSEDIVLKVGVETTGAKKGLDKMRNEVKNTAKSVNELGGEGGALSKLTQMNQKTIFSVSNLAQTFQLTQGPANQMKFVLGQIFDQFTLMGPKGLLIGGAVAGIGLLVRKFRESTGAIKDTKKEMIEFRRQSEGLAVSIQGEFAAIDKIANIKKTFSPGPLRDFEIRLAKLNSEVRINEEASRSATAAQKAQNVVLEMQQNAVAAAGATMSKERKEAEKRLELTKKQFEADNEAFKKLEPERKSKIAILKEEIRMLEAQRSNAQKMQKHHDEENKSLEKKNKLKSDGLKLDKPLTGPVSAINEQMRDEMSEAFEVRDILMEEEEKARQKELDDAKKHAKELAKIKKDAEKEEKKANERKRKEAQSTAETVTGISVGLIQQTSDIMIKGEKDMGAQLGALFLRRTGEMLVADGQARILIGAGMNATAPGTGVGAMVAGAAEVAAGLGMGAASAAITQSISTSQSSAGISTGAPMADRAGIASGEAPRGGSAPTMGGTATDGGGPTVINISYGVGGPAPEQTAQAVADALALATRRGMRGRA